MKLVILITYIFLSIHVNAQIGTSFDEPRKLTTININLESEKVFVYIKPNAKIYFKISDIIEYIDSISNKRNALQLKNLKTLKDTLNSPTRVIEVTDYCYSYVDEDRDKIIKKYNVNSINLQLNQSFEYIGSDLILKGKFMIYSLKNLSFMYEGLSVEKSDGLYGTEYLDFLFPDKTKFFTIIIALGE